MLKKLYGYKEPSFKSHEDIVKFQSEIGFGGVPLLGISADSWQKQKIFSIPDVFVFNSAGNYIPYKDSLKPNCNGPAELFLTELRASKTYNYSDQHTLDSFVKNLEGENCQPVAFKTDTRTDFYIFMTYATFTGRKIYKEKSAIWLDSLKNNRHINYRLFMVNEDLKQCWSEEQKKWFDIKD